jgi:hypothetical protein
MRVTVKASPDEAWAILIDLSSWAEWWPMGSPTLVGDELRKGCELMWGSGPGSVRAVVDELISPALLRFIFTSGDDGMPRKNNPGQWEMNVYSDGTGTQFYAQRWAGPLSGFKRAKVERMQTAINEAFRATVEGAAPAADVPDVEGLVAKDDVDGLLAVLARPEAWARASALTHLSIHLGDRRVVDAVFRATSDPDGTVREVAARHLTQMKDQRAKEVLLQLVDDPHGGVHSVAADATRGIRAAAAAGAFRGYSTDELKRLEDTEGPRLDGNGDEVFIAPPLAVHIAPYSVFREDATISAGNEASRTAHVVSRVIFPPICSGCLEATDRAVVDAYPLTWTEGEQRGTTLRTTTITVTIRFAVPLCERCVGYGSRSLIVIDAISRGLEAPRKWVRFRFPNLGYYVPFAKENGVGWNLYDGYINHVPKHEPMIGIRELPKWTKDDVKRLESDLTAWESVASGPGLHGYVQLKSSP